MFVGVQGYTLGRSRKVAVFFYLICQDEVQEKEQKQWDIGSEKRERKEFKMPFKSVKQRKWMWANKPAMAKKWTRKYGSKVKK